MLSCLVIFLFLNISAYVQAHEQNTKNEAEVELSEKEKTKLRLAHLKSNTFHVNKSATAFYLGKYNGKYVFMAPKHVVNRGNCRSRKSLTSIDGAEMSCSKVIIESPHNADFVIFTATPNNNSSFEAIQKKKGIHLSAVSLDRSANFSLFGFPNDTKQGILLSGKISEHPELKNTSAVFQLSSKVQSGFSGAPVMDRSYGGIVGMTYAMNPKTKEAIVYSSQYLRALINDVILNGKLSDEDTSLLSKLVRY